MAAAVQAASRGAVRVLRPVELIEGPTGVGDPDAGRIGAAIDVETTGLDVGEDAVIELALRRFRYDEDGRVVRIGRLYQWREDPGRPLPPAVARLTGLADADLAGRTIDDDLAVRLLADVDLVVAHNARFDRPFTERRLDGIRHLVWGCSMAQVDWAALGFDGCKLGYLLNQVDLYHEPHGAGADVDALIALLAHAVEPGRTALSHVLDGVARDVWKVSALGAAMGVKDVLRRRGYRWDPGMRTWWREVDDDARADEEAWLDERVYGERGRALGQSARWERLDARRRFA